MRNKGPEDLDRSGAPLPSERLPVELGAENGVYSFDQIKNELQRVKVSGGNKGNHCSGRIFRTSEIIQKTVAPGSVNTLSSPRPSNRVKIDE